MILTTVMQVRCTSTWRRGLKLCDVEFSNFKRKTRHFARNSCSVAKRAAAFGNWHVQRGVREWVSFTGLNTPVKESGSLRLPRLPAPAAVARPVRKRDLVILIETQP